MRSASVSLLASLLPPPICPPIPYGYYHPSGPRTCLLVSGDGPDERALRQPVGPFVDFRQRIGLPPLEPSDQHLVPVLLPAAALRRPRLRVLHKDNKGIINTAPLSTSECPTQHSLLARCDDSPSHLTPPFKALCPHLFEDVNVSALGAHEASSVRVVGDALPGLHQCPHLGIPVPQRRRVVEEAHAQEVLHLPTTTDHRTACR